ncbi:MAG: arsenosugar biosynthesis radical SAM protein ArsS [Elusimicrobia bacterium]|nr:arsenosugar biosynthesis radical SAM protein ArsS [Elusimicrobiota bacterium]
MNTFTGVLQEHDIDKAVLRRGRLTTLQVNMGNLCNQSCRHCHIEASPDGKNLMSRKVVDEILEFLSRNKLQTLDVTGGAPELNPHFEQLVASGRPLVEELIVRSNLTVLLEKGKEHLPEFFKRHEVRLICSLPCYTRENVDGQRGAGVFEKSVRALRLLNKAGFAGQAGLRLDLVYNPSDGSLPAPGTGLEKDYREVLRKEHGIEFNRLLTIANVPIKKFKSYLESCGDRGEYARLLEANFNPRTLDSLMCRTFLSVGYDGRLYDCDFNLALGYALKDETGKDLLIGGLRLSRLEGRDILTGEHCLACTAGSGSSCQGALTNVDPRHAPATSPDAKETVKEYYGRVLRGKKDLKTSACCTGDSMPESLRAVISRIEPEILDKFYGCGSPFPPLLDGCRVLDLGCGTGRDVYVAACLAGEDGFATGIDMTDEQLAVARRHQDSQMRRFGFSRFNTDFRKGYIEDLKGAGIEDSSQDVVISNCVINLSPDKPTVFSEIFRVLRPGGELYFSDVFSDRRVPDSLRGDPVLHGECLAGAMYVEDFRRLLRAAGCLDWRMMSKTKIEVAEPGLRDKTAGIGFYSMTIRAFKLDLEDICEDYGQVAFYRGTIPGCPHSFRLDDHHVFVKDKPMLVCGNTAAMLGKTRFSRHFKVLGDTSSHFGPFPCAPGARPESADAPAKGGSCC